MIFIWIPKTAGTSFYEALKAKYDMKLFTEDYHKFDNTGHVTFGHADIKQLIGKVIDLKYWHFNDVFTVVRNPYDRFISLYLDYQRTGRIAPNMTTHEFAHLLNHVSRKIGLYNSMDFSMCANQTDWLTQDTQIYNLEEHYRIENVFGIELPYLNIGKTKNWKEYYDNYLLKQVTDLYAVDFATLNYRTYDNIQQIG